MTHNAVLLLARHSLSIA